MSARSTAARVREAHAPDAPALPEAARYAAVRKSTERLCEPLAAEDCVVQSMPDVSPTRWHLAHTTWFFENFVCRRAIPSYEVFHPGYDYLFNSYYNAEGPQFPRPQRGLLSRPTVDEVLRYRAHVDAAMLRLIGSGARGGSSAGPGSAGGFAEVIELGLQHEQQHQELILTDIKHVLSMNPLRPIYLRRAPDPAPPLPPAGWIHHPEGIVRIGAGPDGFAFDNERPAHRVFLEAFSIADRPVTNAEYIAFIRDGGYSDPLLWLSMGWAAVRGNGWRAPLYWEERDGAWWSMTLAGMLPVNGSEPVCHVSLFEADAFARWAGARLPTEMEWERAATSVPIDSPMRGAFVEDGRYHPPPLRPQPDGASTAQPDGASSARPQEGGAQAIFGSVWEWTRSSYDPYPGFAPPPGALGEYNGKFMCNQTVLRGGSCATPIGHIRPTYRNFFPPDARWQFSGIRLAKEA